MEASEFAVGRRYRNRAGYYEVLDIGRGQLIVRYDDGQQATINATIAARIYTNMEHEDTQQIPPGLSRDTEVDAVWTVGALARYGDFQADIPPRAYPGFVADYREATGVTTLNGVREVVLLPTDTDKWGIELRIYLPEALAYNERFVLPMGVEVSAGFGAGTKRINKNWFWWHLVRRLGFRLGRDQDLAAIEAAIPEHLRAAFREGAQYKLL